MVVVIIGILTAIAMPLYSRSKYRSFALEASEVLGRITAAQEGRSQKTEGRRQKARTPLAAPKPARQPRAGEGGRS